MSPKSLSDRELLCQTQKLVQKERALLSEILQHLKEVERRKLYSDLGYTSLFDYCVGELKYSEGQTGRRIQALKLIRELPQVEEKIESGALNLSHICQAQRFFTQVQKSELNIGLVKEDKLQVLIEIENKSARQAQAWLVQKAAQAGLGTPLPPEKERVLSQEHSEFRVVISQKLRQKLEEVRSLLGPKALGLSLAELMTAMAELSLEALKDKKFGKKRRGHESSSMAQGAAGANAPKPNGVRSAESTELADSIESPQEKSPTTSEKLCVKPRSISKSQKWRIWQRDGGRCGKCGGHKNLQVDHRVPVALGGTGEIDNLRLLCASCNIREGIKHFGPVRMRRSSSE